MSAARTAWDRWSPEVRLGVVAGIVAIAWAMVVLDPLGPATIDPDASSSVLYFERLVAGRRLEAFVPTTPKPLLTLVFGATWTLLHDWRALVLETILAWGVAVGAVGALAARLGRGAATGAKAGAVAGATGMAAFRPAVAGAAAEGFAAVGHRAVGPRAAGTASSGFVPTVAGAAAAGFAAAALLGSSDFLLDVSRANSLVWALAGWSIAGLAATARPARPWVAGAALLLAGLCRVETLALTGVAVAVALAMTRGRPNRVPAVAVGALLAAAALPLAMLHDLAITGDPLYWLNVPTRYTEVFNPGLAAIPPLTYAGTLAGRFAPEWPLLALAAVGVVALVRARAWVPLAGILGLGLGVVALLFRLAIGGIYISNRYYEPIELVLILAAAVGLARIAGWLVARWAVARGMPGRRPSVAAGSAGSFGLVGPFGLVVTTVAVAAGILASWPALPWDRRAATELADVRRASAHLAIVRPHLERLLGPTKVDRDPERATQLLVPSRDVARVSVETAQPLDRILNSYAVLLNGGLEALQPGQVVFHDAAADRPVALFRPVEIDDQGPAGGSILVRLDPRIPEIWLLSVR